MSATYALQKIRIEEDWDGLIEISRISDNAHETLCLLERSRTVLLCHAVLSVQWHTDSSDAFETKIIPLFSGLLVATTHRTIGGPVLLFISISFGAF